MLPGVCPGVCMDRTAGPPPVCVEGDLNLPRGRSEEEVRWIMKALASRNVGQEALVSFLGGGVYDTYAPAAVDAIEGSGRIDISIARDARTLKMAIRDTGSGMTAEQMQRIFQPFFTTKETGKGTGLGLSVSSGIIEGLGGIIEVESQPGKGSTFTVVLPL